MRCILKWRRRCSEIRQMRVMKFLMKVPIVRVTKLTTIRNN